MEPLDPNRMSNAEIEDLAFNGDPEGRLSTEGRELHPDYLEFRSHYENPEMHMTEEERQILRQTRNALSEIAQDSLTTTLKAVRALDRLEQLPTMELEGGETGMIQTKDAKRKATRQKESSPRRYDEKLLVISDLQLLHETNEEGVGALLKYVKAHGHEFTHVVLNGDIIDFQQQSSFKQDNQLGDSVTQDEQVAGRWFIDFIGRHCPSANKVFLKGNHEARYDNMYLNTSNGVKQYMKPFQEVFGLQDWTVLEYGQGVSFEHHKRLFRHGTKGGLVTNIPKLEMERNWRPTTVGHAITNRMWEFVEADGQSNITFVHAGFSKTAMYDKTGDKKPSNGFGVYYYVKDGRKWIETPYQVIFSTQDNMFVSPEGEVFSGKGFNLREEIGLDPRGPGRPRKQL